MPKEATLELSPESQVPELTQILLSLSSSSADVEACIYSFITRTRHLTRINNRFWAHVSLISPAITLTRPNTLRSRTGVGETLSHFLCPHHHLLLRVGSTFPAHLRIAQAHYINPNTNSHQEEKPNRGLWQRLAIPPPPSPVRPGI